MSTDACDPRWSAYADYTRLRNAGLRKDALAAATDCARQIVDAGAQGDFTRWLFGEIVRPRIPLTPVLPHQLREIALPALWDAHADGQSWATKALIDWFPAEVMAAYDYCTDAVRVMLTRALAEHPGDVVLSALLARHLLTWVRHDIADLARGRYDGDPREDLARLAEARGLIGADDPMGGEIEQVRAVVEHWIAAGQRPSS